MTNDRHYYRDGTDQLWRVAPDETPRPYTEAEGWRRMQIWGMGIASADLTGDGYPEVYLTSQGDNKLQTLADGPAQPTYEDIALERGATAHRPYAGGDVLPSTAWHAEFADVNNDGFLDLFVAKGNVEAQPEYATRDPSNLLIGQADGTFVEGGEAAGIVSYDRARGAALVDLNLDGLLDLVVVNRAEPVTVWRNVGAGDADAPAPMGNWIAVRLRQPAPNVDGIGAWVEVRVGDRTLVHEVTVGGGHAGGSARLAALRSRRRRARPSSASNGPTARTGPWMTLDAGEFAIIERGSSRRRHRGIPRRSKDEHRNEAGRARRRRASGLRDARRPSRCSRQSIHAERMERLRRPHGGARATTTSSCGPIGSTAPTSPTSPGSTRASRRRCSSCPASGTPALLVGNECFATAEAAPLRLRCVRFQDLSLPEPAARLVVAARRHPRRRGHRIGQPRRRRRVEDVRQPGDDRGAVVPRRRAPPGDGSDRSGGERHRPAHRRRRRTARDQRGRAAGGVRVGGLPDVDAASATCSTGLRPG